MIIPERRDRKTEEQVEAYEELRSVRRDIIDSGGDYKALPEALEAYDDSYVLFKLRREEASDVRDALLSQYSAKQNFLKKQNSLYDHYLDEADAMLQTLSESHRRNLESQGFFDTSDAESSALTIRDTGFILHPTLEDECVLAWDAMGRLNPAMFHGDK